MEEIIRFAFALVFVGVVGFYIARHKEALSLISPRRAWRTMRRMKRDEWAHLLSYSVAFIVVALLVIPLVANILIFTTGQPLTRAEEHPITITASASLPVAFLLMGTLPIFEEWLWRGIVLERLRRRLPVLNAVMISAFGFGLSHLLNSGTFFWAFVPPTVAGFIFCAAYIKCGLGGAVLTHSGYNLIALGLLFA